jgi:hypothetical protein
MSIFPSARAQNSKLEKTKIRERREGKEFLVVAGENVPLSSISADNRLRYRIPTGPTSLLLYLTSTYHSLVVLR